MAWPFGVLPLQVWWFSHPSVTLLPVGMDVTRGYCLLSGLTLRGSSFFAIMVGLSSLVSSPPLVLKVGRGLLTSALVALPGLAFA